MNTVEVQFSRGTCPIRVFGDVADSAAPIVLFFMDGFGPRPALFAMAEDLASLGYRVLLPHLFYEHLPDAAITPASVLSGGKDRARLMTMLAGLDQAAVDADVAALLAFADETLGATAPLAATGYCMGGRYALTAATSAPRVRFVAAFHGANLAPETGDSAHHRFKGLTAKVYIGVAGPDKGFGGAEEGRLAAALRDAEVDHMIETFAGAQHGFALPDLPMHDAAAAQRHWRRLTSFLEEAFAKGV